MYKKSLLDLFFDNYFERVMSIVLIGLVLGMILTFVISFVDNKECFLSPSSLECKTHKVAECMKTELYTKDQCVILVGGGK